MIMTSQGIAAGQCGESANGGGFIMLFQSHRSKLSLWRNGLAHWTSNSKVVGSSPTRDAAFCSFTIRSKIFFSFFFDQGQ